MRISMIVAAGENNVIGRNNDLPWKLPKDMRYFKETTSGHPVVMGRKTLESLGNPLPNRTNIVITRNSKLPFDGIIITSTPTEALEKAAKEHNEEVFIIGGGEIFTQTLAITDRVYLTRVHYEFEGDAYFPELPENEWQCTSADHHEPDEKHAYAFTFEVWDRKK
jgi:dihydrofolate reductase